MKLLVSDYDLTLNVLDFGVWFNVNAINKFRENGNTFFLNTGRDYKSIKREINKYHINYDYLGCNDGNLILNRNNDIIFCSDLPNDYLLEIEKLKNNYDIDINIFKYQGNVLEYEIRTLPNWNLDLNIRYLASKNNLCVKKFEESKIINSKLQRVWIYYLYDEKVNKASATALVAQLENIEKCDIFTIGDNHNDLEMLREFNGYTFPWGKKEVKNVSNGQVLSVRNLVKKISR